MSALCQISNNPNMKELAGLCQPGRRPVSNTEFNSRSRRGVRWGGGVGGCAPTALITPPRLSKDNSSAPNPGQNKRHSQRRKNTGRCERERHDDQSEAAASRPGSGWMIMMMMMFVER